MTKEEREKMKLYQSKLRALYFDMQDLIDEIEAWVMKKTTQRSPEFHGGANC